MGKRGPTGRPNHIKIVEGVREDRVNRDEPLPEVPETADEITPPVELTDDARAVWDRLAPDLFAKKVLTPWDVDLFAVFCTAVATFNDCRQKMGDEYTARGAAGGVIKSPYWQIMRDAQAMMSQTGSKFGLSPGDRAGLVISDDNKPNGESNPERLLS